LSTCIGTRKTRRQGRHAGARLQRRDEQLAAIAPTWSMAPVVEAYQAKRGVSFVVAVTFVAEIGDLRRFDNRR
jgi:transposase